MSVALRPLLDNALVVNSEKSLDALLDARFVMKVMCNLFYLRIYKKGCVNHLFLRNLMGSEL